MTRVKAIWDEKVDQHVNGERPINDPIDHKAGRRLFVEECYLKRRDDGGVQERKDEDLVPYQDEPRVWIDCRSLHSVKLLSGHLYRKHIVISNTVGWLVPAQCWAVQRM